MIIREDLKTGIFSTNKFNEKEVKNLITYKNMLYLVNRLKAIKQTIELC